MGETKRLRMIIIKDDDAQIEIRSRSRRRSDGRAIKYKKSESNQSNAMKKYV